MMKRFCLATIALCATALSLMSCGGGKSSNAANNKNLVVWSFTDELKGMINDYYTPAHPDVKVEYSMTPTDQFPNKLDPVLQS